MQCPVFARSLRINCLRSGGEISQVLVFGLFQQRGGSIESAALSIQEEKPYLGLIALIFFTEPQ